MNLETKITIYKFTPQVFTLTPVSGVPIGGARKVERESPPNKIISL